MAKKIRKIKYVYDMYYNLCFTDQKAIKEHKCGVCKGIIDKGEIYTVCYFSPKKRKGRFLSRKICIMHDREDVLMF